MILFWAAMRKANFLPPAGTDAVSPSNIFHSIPFHSEFRVLGKLLSKCVSFYKIIMKIKIKIPVILLSMNLSRSIFIESIVQ